MLVKVNLKDGSVTSIPLPRQYAQPAAADHEVYRVFDPNNRVLLISNNFDMGTFPLKRLGIYHLHTGRREWEAVPPAVFGSVWSFDEATGGMIGIGERLQPFAYFLYKYASGPR